MHNKSQLETLYKDFKTREYKFAGNKGDFRNNFIFKFDSEIEKEQNDLFKDICDEITEPVIEDKSILLFFKTVDIQNQRLNQHGHRIVRKDQVINIKEILGIKDHIDLFAEGYSYHLLDTISGAVRLYDEEENIYMID